METIAWVGVSVVSRVVEIVYGFGSGCGQYVLGNKGDVVLNGHRDAMMNL